jgi:hypothetical protein
MRTILLIYAIAYTLVAIGGFAVHVFLVPREEKTGDAPGETVLDVILILIGLAGMVFLLLDFAPNGLKSAWRIVSVGLVLTQFWLNLRGRSRHLAENPGTERSLFVRMADFGLLAVLAPSLAFNLISAFGT